MPNTQHNTVWSVWIDKAQKIITIKESPNAKQIFFASKEDGIHKITVLASQGYKIG